MFGKKAAKKVKEPKANKKAAEKTAVKLEEKKVIKSKLKSF